MKSLKAGLVPQAVTAPNRSVLAEELLNSYWRSKEFEAKAPAPYRTSAVWKFILDREKPEYVAALEARDPSQLMSLLEHFFRNSGSSGLTDFGTFNGVAGGSTFAKMQFINCVLHDYRVWRNLNDEPDPASLRVPPFGDSWGYVIEDTLVTQLACRHHNLAMFCKSLLQRVSKPVVVEIGGGFGGMASFLCSNQPDITYINFDLPDTLLLSSFYLSSAFPDRSIAYFGASDPATVLNSLKSNKYEIILYPSFCLPHLPERSVDLFINTRSLSEMPHKTVSEYLDQVGRACRGYFFHENSVDPKDTRRNHMEVPVARFPLPTGVALLHKAMSPWKAGGGRYREHLYERIN